LTSGCADGFERTDGPTPFERYFGCSIDNSSDQLTSPPTSAASLLTPEQHFVVSQIIQSVFDETDQLIFLQGAAGSGKTVTVKKMKKSRQFLIMV
jgi:type I site-specific restriction endonuclease